jgi:predicted AlkP superfamily phosphohydrolase/phosphomutase
MSRLFVLGIDGATFNLLEPMVEKGNLPAFSKVMEGGAYGRLESPVPPETMSAWPAILTGKDPGTLGVLEFWEVNRKTYKAELSPIRWDEWNPLWKILDAQGKKVCICNVPTAYAPEDNFSGLFVSGPQSQGGELRRMAYPEELENTLKKINYQIYAPSIMTVGKDRFPHIVCNLTARKMKIASMLFSREQWDFFMFGLFYSDQMGHFYWKYTDETHPDFRPDNPYTHVILDYYRMVDGWLNDLLSSGENILIVSDHGQDKTLKYVNINAWLKSKNLLFLTKEGENRLRQADILTTMKINGYSYYARLTPRITEQDIDWSRTMAYSVNNCTININMQGREAKGCVAEGEDCENVRRLIKKELPELEDQENGWRVIEDVYFREELYSGYGISKLPDIIFTYKNDSYYYNPSLNAGYFPSRKILYRKAPDYCFEMERSAHHRRHGVFIAYGPDIKKGERIEGARNIDVMPTILHCLQVPVPEDVQGSILHSIFREDRSRGETAPHRRTDEGFDDSRSYGEERRTEEEERIVERRLKALGYI